MEIMLPPEYFSSMQSVSMLNSQESNAFITWLTRTLLYDDVTSGSRRAA